MCLTAIFAYLAVGLCFLDPNLATIEISGHSAYDVFKTILIVVPILALVICCLTSAMDIYIDSKSARIRNKMQKELRKALATRKKMVVAEDQDSLRRVCSKASPQNMRSSKNMQVSPAVQGLPVLSPGASFNKPNLEMLIGGDELSKMMEPVPELGHFPSPAVYRAAKR